MGDATEPSMIEPLEIEFLRISRRSAAEFLSPRRMIDPDPKVE